MPIHLYLAPAAAGKTAYVLAHARDAGRDLAAVPRVVVATHLQARAARRRLAGMGGTARCGTAACGTIGVRVLTFDRLNAELLDAAGEVYVELSEPVQYRLIRAVVDSLPLTHYAPLTDRPGFIQVLQRLIGELKAAAVRPDAFAAAVRALGDEPRLAELAQVYGAYQARLQAQGWADRAGLGWLAVEALEQRAPGVGRDWPLLAVDGFDSFTPIQVALLRALAGRAGELTVTLTGDLSDDSIGQAHGRFLKTRAALELALNAPAEPLPGSPPPVPRSSPEALPALSHLARGLLRPGYSRVDAAGAVELIEAPERAGEVRAGLRWLKQRILLDGFRAGEVALLARDIAPYRPFVRQIAAEFGVPIRLVDGSPLAENPAVAALLGLLQMVLPDPTGRLSLPRRSVVEAWRSPYFDWSAPAADGAVSGDASIGDASTGDASIGDASIADASIADASIGPGDADALDTVGRWGRVIGGETQWSEALARLAGLASVPSEDEDRGAPAALPRGEAARALQARFEHFVTWVAPPGGAHSYREYAGWLEALIGADDPAAAGRFPVVEDAASLRVVARVRAGGAAIAERDIAALAGIKDVLRGLVWAEEALGAVPIDFARFVTELTGALDAASYSLPVHADREEILVAGVVQARGLPFRAVAVLGLAEGEFPATLGEDPFLRDADRRRLRGEPFRLPLELTAEGAEAEFFYEAVTRPAERLLLTRPRLADNGADWQASPYWEAVRRLVAVEPAHLTSKSAPRPDEAASWPELLESLAAHDGYAAVRRWAEQTEPARTTGVAVGAEVLRIRIAPHPTGSVVNGDLTASADTCAARFAPEQPWSASRLESYRSCPFAFFVRYMLGLEPRTEPVEGLDVRQLGNIYHHIFERLYRAVVRSAGDPAGLDALMAALPAIAGEVLDEAPRVEGFRTSAWWLQTRAEIVANALAFGRGAGRSARRLRPTGAGGGLLRKALPDRSRRGGYVSPAGVYRPGRPRAGWGPADHRLQDRRSGGLQEEGGDRGKKAPTAALRAGGRAGFGTW